MPRAKAKTSAELDADIKAMQEKITAMRKEKAAAKKREDREAARIREYEMNQLNAAFVDLCKDLYFEDHRDKTCSVYDLLWSAIESRMPFPEGLLRPHEYVMRAASSEGDGGNVSITDGGAAEDEFGPLPTERKD